MAYSDNRATAVRLLVATTVLVGGYLGLCEWSARHLPASVSIGGIEVGGMSPMQAQIALEKGARARLDTPIAVSVPGRPEPVAVLPSQAGFHVDTEGSLDGLSGFTLDPQTIWSRLAGTVDLPLLTSVDDGTLTAYLEQLAPSVDTRPTEGSVTFPGGKVVVSAPVAGSRLDLVSTKFALRRAFPDSTTATASVKPVPPVVSAAAIAAAADGFAKQAMSAPVTLHADTTETMLTPAEFAPAVSMTPDGHGNLVPTYDSARLTSIVAGKLQVTTKPARNATWTFQNDRPVLHPSADGTAVDATTIPERMVAAMASADRRVTIDIVTTNPTFSTQDAQLAGVTQAVASFTSPLLADDPGRTHNVVVATHAISGTYIPPGGTFSLNAILGEWTAAKGYADGTLISNGRLTRGTGGGSSQVSTMIYNLAYFAGADILEATPHAFFSPRYPEGREATVSWPKVDNMWKNDTAHGMLLQTWVANGYVQGRVWSTKTWDITSVVGPRTNVVPARRVEDGSLGCYPQQPNPGFDVTVTRQWYQPGSTVLVKSEDVHTHYLPENQVVCTNPKART